MYFHKYMIWFKNKKHEYKFVAALVYFTRSGSVHHNILHFNAWVRQRN